MDSKVVKTEAKAKMNAMKYIKIPNRNQRQKIGSLLVRASEGKERKGFEKRAAPDKEAK